MFCNILYYIIYNNGALTTMLLVYRNCKLIQYTVVNMSIQYTYTVYTVNMFCNILYYIIYNNGALTTMLLVYRNCKLIYTNKQS